MGLRMKSENQKEWEFQERRYNRAKRRADRCLARAKKYNALTQAWVKIMTDANEAQKRIEAEVEEEEAACT